jgi:diguanylate cyclase (GGDEF)-like protein
MLDKELDLMTLTKSYRAISSVIVPEELIQTLLDNVIENAGAQKGVLVFYKNGGLYVEAQGKAGSKTVELLSSLPVEEAQHYIPVSVIYSVERSLQPLVLDDASQSANFSQDIYIITNNPLSMLCVPILHQGKLTGVLYLENSLTKGAFTQERIELLNLLVAQAAISIENSTLYAELEEKVQERTAELQDLLEVQKHLNSELSEKSQMLDEAYDELRDVNDKLAHQANTDDLTGLANRRNFNRLIEHEYRRCIRGKQPLSVLMSDLDNFKAFNDHYGHLEGDECLRIIANVFRQVFCRSTDVVARYGGEEIVVVLPDTDQDEALKLAETLRTSVKELQLPHAGNGSYNIVTISVGCVSLIPSVTESVDSIIQKADKALYDAKDLGRNRVCSFEDHNQC